MNKITKLLAWGIFGLAVTITGAQSQNRITYGQVMNSLASNSQTAKRIGIDTDAIRRDIEARIKAEGTENAQTPSPALDVLRKLPQLIVQIQFDLDADSIRPESWVTIGKIADGLHHPLLMGKRFLIVGHTDAKGKRLYNLDLSQRRALSVAKMLKSIFRVEPKMLLTMGLGEEQLFDPANPNNGVNRRVELINIGPS